MKITLLTTNLVADLRKHYDPAYQKTSLGFFKEPVNLLGVRSFWVKKIFRHYWPEIKNLNKKEMFVLCESLFALNFNETTSLSLEILNRRKDPEIKDFPQYQKWFKKYISNWAGCDDFCVHALGRLVSCNPLLLNQTEKWVRSKNRWQRRASAVVLIYSLRRKECLGEAFKIAKTLLIDPDLMVQKGYGWMLKEASKAYPNEVFDFVLKHKNPMPRLALRYAIEKLPEKMKKEAMVKE